MSEGKVTRVGADARGRALLAWTDLAPEVAVPMDAEEVALVFGADVGDADAQNNLGQVFLRADKCKAALYWLRQAADQDNADAMHWLAHCYFNGKGVPQDNNLGTMWLAKAAAHGHVIAQAQMHALIGKMLSESPPTTTAKRE